MIHNFCYFFFNWRALSPAARYALQQHKKAVGAIKKSNSVLQKPPAFQQSVFSVQRCQFNKIHVFLQKAHTSFVGKRAWSLPPAAGNMLLVYSRDWSGIASTWGEPSWKPQGFGISKPVLPTYLSCSLQQRSPSKFLQAQGKLPMVVSAPR